MNITFKFERKSSVLRKLRELANSLPTLKEWLKEFKQKGYDKTKNLHIPGINEHSKQKYGEIQ